MLGAIRWVWGFCLIVAAVTFAGGCGGGAVTISSSTVPPKVTATVPAAGAPGVAVNSAVVAVFDKAMNPGTITTATFTLTSPASTVSGTVALNPGGTIATFTPGSQLAAGTTFTATITTGARDTGGNPLANNFTWSFTTGTASDTIPPAVISTTPANGATGVAVNAPVTVTFSEPVSAVTVNAATITLSSASGPVAGTVAFNGTTTATFIPTSQLAASTLYTATVTTGVTDLAGNPMVGNLSFSFTTGAAADTVRPTVLSTLPASGTIGVAVNTTVNTTFSEVVNAATVNAATFTLAGPAGPVTGTVVLNPGGTTATFTPGSQLAANTTYTATVTTGVTDLAGNPLSVNFTFAFSTGPDTVPPTVLSVTPTNGASGVSLNPAVSVTFSEAMNPITPTTFTLSGNTTGPVAGNVFMSGTTAQFVPLAPLTTNTTFTATIRSGATDLAGNPLATPFIWSFTTGP